MDRFDWLDTATSRIRFGPDRARVRQELEDHILDRIEAARARGSSSRQAEQAALEAMGDPVPLAAELGALHRPWLGYLWRLSRVLVVVLALCIAVNWTYFQNFFNNGSDWAMPDPPPDAAYVWQDLSLGEAGGYRFTVPLAYWAQRDDGTWSGTVILQGASWRFWERWIPQSILAARDNRGISYSCLNREDSVEENAPRFYGNPVQSSYTSATAELRFLDMPDPEDLQWLQLTIGDETLTIFLEGGEGP